ncbi:MAG: 3'-5' exonuclease [Burkholderiaceae bacterium]
MVPVLCFDIETIPDAEGLRALWQPGADQAQAPDDATLVAQAQAARREKNGTDFLPLHQHRIVAIGCLLRDDSGLTIRCVGKPDDTEAKQLALFFRLIDRYTPQLVSWNGGGFDLPVMHYRCLVNGLTAERYWEMGEDDREFKWNNYISRYHGRHLDLMDLLAMYSPRANAPLDQLARICGFPGKLGMDGSQVWTTWQQGGIEQIRDYCETDVANTYLMFCRFQLLRGHFTREQYDAEIALVRKTLADTPGRHWQEFLAAWPEPR